MFINKIFKKKTKEEKFLEDIKKIRNRLMKKDNLNSNYYEISNCYLFPTTFYKTLKIKKLSKFIYGNNSIPNCIVFNINDVISYNVIDNEYIKLIYFNIENFNDIENNIVYIKMEEFKKGKLYGDYFIFDSIDDMYNTVDLNIIKFHDIKLIDKIMIDIIL